MKKKSKIILGILLIVFGAECAWSCNDILSSALTVPLDFDSFSLPHIDMETSLRIDANIQSLLVAEWGQNRAIRYEGFVSNVEAREVLSHASKPTLRQTDDSLTYVTFFATPPQLIALLGKIKSLKQVKRFGARGEQFTSVSFTHHMRMHESLRTSLLNQLGSTAAEMQFQILVENVLAEQLDALQKNLQQSYHQKVRTYFHPAYRMGILYCKLKFVDLLRVIDQYPMIKVVGLQKKDALNPHAWERVLEVGTPALIQNWIDPLEDLPSNTHRLRIMVQVQKDSVFNFQTLEIMDEGEPIVYAAQWDQYQTFASATVFYYEIDVNHFRGFVEKLAETNTVVNIDFQHVVTAESQHELNRRNSRN